MGINEKLQQIIDALATMQTSLDTIVINTTPSIPPTPPIHTFDELFDLISDIVTYTNTIAGLTATMQSDISVTKSLTATIRDNSHNIRDYTNDTRTRLWYGFRNMGLSVESDTFVYTNDSFIFELLNWLGLISGAIGVPIQANNRTVIQLLSLMQDRLTSGDVTGGLYPNDICADYYASTGMIFVPTGIAGLSNDTLWADFPLPPPTGIEFGSTFDLGLDSDTTELVVLEDNWNNWRFYVASSAPNFGIYIGTDFDVALRRYPSNVWQQFIGMTNNLSFYVLGSESIKVFMCYGTGAGSSSGGPWGGGTSSGGEWGVSCYTLNSQLATVTYPPGISPPSHTRYVSQIPSSIEATNVHSFTGFTFTYNIDAIMVGDFNGWTVRLISGNDIRWIGVSPANAAIGGNIPNDGSPLTINVDTTHFGIDNWVDNAVSPGPPFVVELCRP